MNRRDFILSAAIAGATGLAGTQAIAQKAPAATSQTVLVVGDSLSAEYGLKRGEGWVALMEKRLAEQNIAARVVNASISGETSAGGRSRIDALLKQSKPDLVVIELGANDALRGLPVAQTQDNLAAIVNAAKLVNAKVLLVGIQVPPNYGMAYLNSFSKVFSSVGTLSKVPVVPFMLRNVADGPDAATMFQADRIHPVAAAHPRILDNIWPEFKKLLLK